MDGVRIDKWLWAARFFKTREQAAKACELRRITSNQQAAKASREVKVGDMLDIRNEGGQFEVKVLSLSEQRGPAANAQALYRETDQSKIRRQQAIEERKLLGPYVPSESRRPSKRDRRLIHNFRGDD